MLEKGGGGNMHYAHIYTPLTLKNRNNYIESVGCRFLTEGSLDSLPSPPMEGCKKHHCL